tara:strand:- start:315 stop:1502 length:1188 start_codon:yes stop_codon:yes gene_type:complete
MLKTPNQPYMGPTILQNSFRPFFIAAGFWATLAVPFWLLSYAGILVVPDNFDILLWHQHEMLYGFTSAAITGFILTVIPNWTGRLPIRGVPLGLLISLWILGRIGFLTTVTIGPLATAVFDLPFLIVLVLTITREIISGNNWRNIPVVILISVFALGNFLVHLQILNIIETAELGLRLSMFVLSVLVALIGGRIIPSFTRNWLVKINSRVLPNQMGVFDKIALITLVIFVIAQIAKPEHQATALLALFAGLLHSLRLMRWKGWMTFAEPLIWILHIAYAWLVIALVLIGLSGLSDFVPYTSAIHALTVGAFSTMILAVMTRASLGHTNRVLKATTGTTTVFILITFAAILRVYEPFLNESNNLVIWISGIVWTAAFALFSILYFPILTQARKQKK